ncbi:MAG: LacI family DNA-binding transcriptional regulator [Opitutus sp.]|nr:LacI family DNA-binding transcriptional regulator [Opitutus sp.]MCS6248392.1 LacI family DNA-binding transcriptional regulator [Opitutus sp.]MCS6275163.1 LacI family DNA-binding transcriptional regulator [Opitutus sp.]MCS6277076.1 LacI family DNA-binding transcriptional regulator [Opitutus sp.]MCS6300198.1 LacI family DNA-binding transcriptional regulator [Opitutus sp.]
MSAELLHKLKSITGCSRATIYRALQGSPLVSSATREKVQVAAQQIGFLLNPLVGEWMARVRNPEARLSRMPMLYLAGHSRAEYAKNFFLTAAWIAARQRARELGFSIEIFYLNHRTDGSERTVDQIRKRGIRAIILARFPPGSPPVKLPWDELSVVAIGFTGDHPPVHTLASHGFETMRHVMEELRQRGYRRPGYVGSLVTEKIGGSRHTADFLACRESFPEALEVPPLRLVMEGDLAPCKAAYLLWFRRYRPDVVVSGGIAEYLAWLHEEGLRIPEEVGYFHLGLRKNLPATRHAAGIPQPGAELGRSAVDTLAAMLYHGETGLPARADIVQTFADSFVEGRTLRAPQKEMIRA